MFLRKSQRQILQRREQLFSAPGAVRVTRPVEVCEKFAQLYILGLLRKAAQPDRAPVGLCPRDPADQRGAGGAGIVTMARIVKRSPRLRDRDAVFLPEGRRFRLIRIGTPAGEIPR